MKDKKNKKKSSPDFTGLCYAWANEDIGASSKGCSKGSKCKFAHKFKSGQRAAYKTHKGK